jgi:hypothetical protein
MTILYLFMVIYTIFMTGSVYPQLPEGSGIVYVENGFLKVTP